MKDRPLLTEKIPVYFSEKEKEAIVEFMLEHTYDVSLSKMIREIVLKYINSKKK